MDAIKIVGTIALVVGVLGLIYGGFSYTEQSQELSAGTLEMSVEEKDRLYIPSWVGLASLAIGGGLLLITSKK